MRQKVQTVQDLKIEIEAIKKTESEGIMRMEKLGKRTETTIANITNRIKEMEERISGAEDTRDEIDSLVKENVKSNKFLTPNIQEIWNIMKRKLNMASKSELNTTLSSVHPDTL